MKLVKIKNKYMFKSKRPNQEHIYLLEYDRHTQSYKAIQTTHLYEIPKNKQDKIKKGFLKEMVFKKLHFPSGIKKGTYVKTLSGDKITLKSVRAKVIDNRIPENQRQEVLDFVK